MIQGLVFDKDGTLFHFGESWDKWASGVIENLAKGDAQRKKSICEAVNFDTERQTLLPSSPIIAATLAEVAALILPFVDGFTHEELATYLDESAANAPMSPAVPLAPLLQEFKTRSLVLGVATNDAEASARNHLSTAQVLEQFDFVVGYDSGHGGKPAPGMLLAFAKAMDLAADQVAMVGDSTHDRRAGRAARMTTIGVLTGPADRATLTPFADVVLADIGEIPTWLDQQS
ncbi:MAG: HAD family hydrolase [Paracoccaceae bacterium]|nr:HAD family hydrolase [Paracoccaceae bacterium]